MSAFVVGTDHIDYLVHAAQTYGRQTFRFNGQIVNSSTADEVGAMLLAENIMSVRHRYPDCEYDQLPGTVPTQHAIGYRYRFPRVRLNAVQVLKALNCYEYQSCEHPGWNDSAAKRFCEVLTSYAIGELPGYDEAKWEVENPAGGQPDYAANLIS